MRLIQTTLRNVNIVSALGRLAAASGPVGRDY